MKLVNVDIGYKKALIHIPELALRPGELYVLFGANGKGKSTMLKTLAGQLTPIKGSIKIGRQVLGEISPVDRARKLALVNSRFAGVPFMTGAEFLALGRTPYTNALGRLKSADREVIAHWSKQQDVEYLLPKMTLAMSDGERQMLALTRALIQEVDYLFLDEPTAFLDYKNKTKALKHLSRLAKEQNKCILITSHDIELCWAYSENFLLLTDETSNIQKVEKSSTTLENIISLCF